MTRLLIAVIAALICCDAKAQSFNNAAVYQPVTGVFPPGQVGVPTAFPGVDQTYVSINSAAFCANEPAFYQNLSCPNKGYMPLSAFASSSALQSAVATLTDQVNKSLEIGAIAAAMKDAIPNPGDRFAIRLNAAAFSGEAAAAIGFSYNLTDSMRASFNYGQGRSQSVFSGGLNFSFR